MNLAFSYCSSLNANKNRPKFVLIEMLGCFHFSIPQKVACVWARMILGWWGLTTRGK